MDTPSLKCPRSGRILTPLSMDFWRLKKEFNRIISDSSNSDGENDETPLKRPAKPLRKIPSSKSGNAVESHLHTPSSRKPMQTYKEEDEEPQTTGAECPRSQLRIPKSTTEQADEDSDQEEVAPRIRPRRKAQKFNFESSSSGDEDKQNSGSAGSSQDGTENISRALFATRIASPSPPPSIPETRKKVAIETNSDDENLPGPVARDNGVYKSPPLKQFNLQNLPKVPATEPKKRTVKGLSRGAMPPPSAPLKRTLKTQTEFQEECDSDDDFDELLEKLRNRRHEDDIYDESQVDLNNTLNEWEKSNADDRRFLESLNEETVPLESCHKDALIYRKSEFNTIKDDLVKKLFALYHRTVFQSRFEVEIPVTWNIRIARSGGYCYSGKSANGEKFARIELSPKVVDRVSRVRDTLIHEMCHAGSWLIHGYRGGHGPLFKFWGQRAQQLLGLVVSRCHQYVIETKYIYKCNGCPAEVRRHSKSLDTSRAICRRCRGRFVLFLNNKRNNQITPASERKPSAFSTFVKEEYKIIKTNSPHLTHGEVMSVLSERWKTRKNGV